MTETVTAPGPAGAPGTAAGVTAKPTPAPANTGARPAPVAPLPGRDPGTGPVTGISAAVALLTFLGVMAVSVWGALPFPTAVGRGFLGMIAGWAVSRLAESLGRAVLAENNSAGQPGAGAPPSTAPPSEGGPPGSTAVGGAPTATV